MVLINAKLDDVQQEVGNPKAFITVMKFHHYYEISEAFFSVCLFVSDQSYSKTYQLVYS